MLRRALLPTLGTSLTSCSPSAVTAGDNRHRPMRAFAELVPINEVPSISSGAHGRFKATIDRENQTISYEVSYKAWRTCRLQAHIHFGQRHTTGGVSVFLCGNPPNSTAGDVPAASGLPAVPGNYYRDVDRSEHRGPDRPGHRAVAERGQRVRRTG